MDTQTGKIHMQNYNNGVFKTRYPTNCATQDSDYQEHTSAGQDTLKPRMIEVWVPAISTVLEPSTATSATTEFAGFLDIAALGAHRSPHYGCNRRRECFCGQHIPQYGSPIGQCIVL